MIAAASRARARLALAAAALLAVAAGACGKDRRTLLFLNLEAGPTDTRAVDVRFSLGERSAAVTLREADGSAIAFPTGDVIDLGSGAGTLEVDAIARDGAGQELARATGSVAVVGGESSALALRLGPGGSGGGDDLSGSSTDLAGADLAHGAIPDLAGADLAGGATVPGPPTNVKAIAAALSANIEWIPPTSDGGSAITAYVVTSSPDDVQAVAFPPATSVTINGLRAAVTYTFTMRAHNAVGDSALSDPSNAITTPANLAKTASASASSTYPFEGYSVARVQDGKLVSDYGGDYSWCNQQGALPAWLELDFGTARPLLLAQLYTSNTYPIRDYQVQVWDGMTWQTAATVTGNTSLVRPHSLIGYTGSKLRIYATSGPTGQPQYARINELEVY